MRVAIMFSGGKDSTLAIDYAMEKGFEISYLLSVKPNRTDCYLYHYATVEFTELQAKAMGLKHFLINCDVADPKKEAELIKETIKNNPVDAILLGGVGLQKTQIRSIEDVVKEFGVKVIVPHQDWDHEKLIKEAIDKGYEIIITSVAVDGLDQNWLGKKLDFNSLEELKKISNKFGFHLGGEGGHYDTFVSNGPVFKKKINISDTKKIWNKDSGYLEIKAKLI